MLNLKFVCVVILNATWTVNCFEICSRTGNYYTYCTADTYCCHDKTECCNRLSVAQIIGIVCGVVAFIVKGVLCVCCCISKYRARAEMMRQPQQANVMYITTTGQTPTGYSPPPSYSHTQYGLQSPYPAYDHGQATTAKHTSPDKTSEQKY